MGLTEEEDEVTSGTLAPTVNQPVAMAYLPVDHAIVAHEVYAEVRGKRLPVVFHIGARALSSHALNVHAGHDDVMAVADTGWGMLFARNAQEAQDLGLIARHADDDRAQVDSKLA